MQDPDWQLKNKPERNEVRYFLYHEFSRLQHYFLITPFPSGAKHSKHSDGTVRATCRVDSEAGTCRGGNEPMRENREKWVELCEQAANEQDAKKLAALILEINFMLEAKELRLKDATVSLPPSTKTE